MRTVPVLLSAQLLKCVKIILKYRSAAKVPSTNMYLFGIPGYNKSYCKFLNACELVRRFSTECGAKRPWTLRGTGLRKHIATISVALDLSENDVSDLATHMGHAIAIHKEIYRQPVANRDVVRMSQVLEKAQGVKTVINDSDTTDNDDENNEYSIVNNLSREIEESHSTISNNSLSLNMEDIYRSAKKQYSIKENRNSANNINLSNKIDEISLNINDSSQSVNMKNTCRTTKKRNSA